jgi:hypothetical protein
VRARTPRPGRPRLRAAGVLAGAVIPLLAGGCADPPLPDAAPGGGTLALDGELIALEVQRCALGGAGFTDAPSGRTEATVAATGDTSDGDPVTVTVRRTGAQDTEGEIQTVEITVGDPATTLRAYVLYAVQDPADGTWTTVAPDEPSGRDPLPGPLLRFGDASLVAEGVAAAPDDGRPVRARVEARCPVGGDGPADLALASPA